VPEQLLLQHSLENLHLAQCGLHIGGFTSSDGDGAADETVDDMSATATVASTVAMSFLMTGSSQVHRKA